MSGTRTLVIAHGKSELIMVKALAFRLRIPICTFARDNGAETIMLSHLSALLAAGPFNNERSLHQQFHEHEYCSRRTSAMPDLRIFTIIDVDGADELKKRHLNKALFGNVCFKDRITPIFNDPNLDVMIKQIMGYQIKTDKVQSYHEVFDSITPEEICDFYLKLKKCSQTNLDEPLEFFIRITPSLQDKIGKMS